MKDSWHYLIWSLLVNIFTTGFPGLPHNLYIWFCHCRTMRLTRTCVKSGWTLGSPPRRSPAPSTLRTPNWSRPSGSQRWERDTSGNPDIYCVWERDIWQPWYSSCNFVNPDFEGVLPEREGGQLPVCDCAQRPHPHSPGRTDPLHTQVRKRERDSDMELGMTRENVTYWWCRCSNLPHFQ